MTSPAAKSLWKRRRITKASATSVTWNSSKQSNCVEHAMSCAIHGSGSPYLRRYGERMRRCEEMRVAAPGEGGGKDGLAPSSSSARPAASCGGHGERPSCRGGRPDGTRSEPRLGRHQAGARGGVLAGRAPQGRRGGVSHVPRCSGCSFCSRCILLCISCMNSWKCSRRLRSSGTDEHSKNVSISSDLPQPTPPYMYTPRGTVTAASSASSLAATLLLSLPPPLPPPPPPPNMLLSDDHRPPSPGLLLLATPV